ncbi:MAG: hypothetical protein IBX50_11215, partial [Marinospirillum sp.]|uniref:DNA methyltransferase n=1 Tax=Marinospirillum sp. TaxID=2183934 RepID=UPI001A0BEF72
VCYLKISWLRLRLTHRAPYPLRVARQYGNPDVDVYVDFICQSLEPVVQSLALGGSIMLNVSNDIFEAGMPSRSTYLEELVLALKKRLGLFLMDRLIWENPSKPPGPTRWACRTGENMKAIRTQLCTGYEPIIWMTNSPMDVLTDNRRILQPHNDRHLKFLAEGNQRTISYGDGAYRLRASSYSNATPGKIQKNVLKHGHACADTRMVHRIARELDLPGHGAMFPTSMAERLIQFATTPDQLVIDLFAGSNKVGLASERNGRRWIATEKVRQFVGIQAELFARQGFDGFWCNTSALG